MQKSSHKEATHCYYCGEPFDESVRNLQKSRDHIIPHSGGGVNLIGNKVPAHKKCNEMKGKMTLPEFARHLLKKIGCVDKNGVIRLDLKYVHLEQKYPKNRLMATRALKLYNKTSKMHKKVLN